MLNGIWIVFRKELLDSLRERRAMISAFVFGPLFGPALFAVIIGFAVSEQVDESLQPIAVPAVGAEHAANLMEHLHSFLIDIERHRFADVEALRDAVQRGDVEVGLVVDEDFPAALRSGAPARLWVVSDRSNSINQVAEHRHPTRRVLVREDVDVLVGEVQRRLQVGPQFQYSAIDVRHLARELAGQRPHRATRRPGGGAVDQVRHGLGLREIELVVQERPLGELAGPRRAGAQRTRACEQPVQHRRPAMRVQFQHVLTRERARRLEIEGEAGVNGGAVRVLEAGKQRRPGRWRLPQHRPGYRVHARAGHPHDADRASARGRGDGRYRVSTTHVDAVARYVFAAALLLLARAMLRVMCHCCASVSN